MQQCLRVGNLCAFRTFAGDRSLESRISENNKCSYVNSLRRKEAGEPASGDIFELELQLQLNPKPELTLESKLWASLIEPMPFTELSEWQSRRHAHHIKKQLKGREGVLPASFNLSGSTGVASPSRVEKT